jgi:hypothetical protein
MRRVNIIIKVISSMLRNTSDTRKNVFSFQKIFLFVTTWHLEGIQLHIVDTTKKISRISTKVKFCFIRLFSSCFSVDLKNKTIDHSKVL